jgi:hypothetical protein
MSTSEPTRRAVLRSLGAVLAGACGLGVWTDPRSSAAGRLPIRSSTHTFIS